MHQVDVQVREEDLKVETTRATGAGGQHVNTTDSAVRYAQQHPAHILRALSARLVSLVLLYCQC